MFIRFVVDVADREWRNLTGLITVSRVLRDEGRLQDYQVDVVNATFAWFNEHLPCPPFAAKLESGAWTPAAVAWFLPNAGEPLRRMWDLVAVCREQSVPVRVLKEPYLERIHYRDQFQVVATAPRRRRRERR